jgi:hypothetical protein
MACRRHIHFPVCRHRKRIAHRTSPARSSLPAPQYAKAEGSKQTTISAVSH